jgi:glycosyltransferase involved in cell wall biosynthesis
VVVGAHSCVYSWAIACNDAAWLSDQRWRHYTKAVKDGLARADAWVCPSQAFHDVIVDLYRPRSSGFVICNGIAPRAAAAGQRDAFILAAGRMWDAAKNLSLLMRAAERLDWPVMVAGPTGGSAPAGSVRLLGELPHAELDRLMRRAAIFASPALYEPFGLSVLEAASAGCALVLADIPTFRELWRGAALFVDPTDVPAWHETLAGLCADAARHAQLREAAFTRSRTYSLRRMVDSYVALDQRLAARAPGLPAAPAIEACV